MRLTNDHEFENTQRKLSDLQAWIHRKEEAPSDSPARELSLESMKVRARKLRAEIDDYVRTHQAARGV